jgi:hypothetical protein
LFTEGEPGALAHLYSGIHASTFSDEVLAKSPNDLAVLSGANLGWTDLGETSRVLSVLGENGLSLVLGNALQVPASFQSVVTSG